MAAVITLFRVKAFRNALLSRGALVWVALRIAAAIGGIADPNLIQEIYILGLVGVLVLLDTRRRGEDLFLGNLAITGTAIGICGTTAALVLEILVP